MAKISGFILPFLFLLLSSCGPSEQSSSEESEKPAEVEVVGGPCETCELMYMGMPNETEMQPRDTSLGWTEGKQQLLVGGQIWLPDGKTPASGTVIYYWHTDENGLYSPSPDMDQRAVKHGYLRGWVKADLMGRWAINTSRPAPYPNRNDPAHIHILVKEPNMENEYYIDALVFDDDPLLTKAKRSELEGRGGNAVMRMERAGKIDLAEHHIYLGKNIPGHPQKY